MPMRGHCKAITSFVFSLRFKVYLFDVRGSSFCHRLTGHTEVVADVAFHPAHSEVTIFSFFVALPAHKRRRKSFYIFNKVAQQNFHVARGMVI